MRMRHIVISGLPRSTIFFHVSHKRRNFEKKKVIESKTCDLVYSPTFETFFILRKIKRDTIKTEHPSSCEVPSFLSDFN